MNDKFTNDATVRVIFFEGEEAENLQPVFEGGISDWREAVGKKWNGFDKGDIFMIEQERVRIYHLSEKENEEGKINEGVYFISFSDVNSNKLNFENLKV